MELKLFLPVFGLTNCMECLGLTLTHTNSLSMLQGRESACRLLESRPTIAIYYYYSPQKLILILLSHTG